MNYLVANKRTRFGGGSKLIPKYLGPSRTIKVKSNKSYYIIKEGSHVGSTNTSTSAVYLKVRIQFRMTNSKRIHRRMAECGNYAMHLACVGAPMTNNR